jgi:hypothetical protein
MPFCFRAKFYLAHDVKLDAAHEELVVVVSTTEHVVLRPRDSATLDTAGELELRGCGYRNEPEARDAGLRWTDAIRRGLASLHVGADFGVRQPKSSGRSGCRGG